MVIGNWLATAKQWELSVSEDGWSVIGKTELAPAHEPVFRLSPGYRVAMEADPFHKKRPALYFSSKIISNGHIQVIESD
jgi:hypothetical protein